MFAAFVAKLGEIVAPIEEGDDSVGGSLANVTNNSSTQEISVTEGSQQQVASLVNEYKSIPEPSGAFRTETGVAGVASALTSSNNMQQQHARLNRRNTSTATNCKSSMINAGHLFSLTTGVQTNFIGAEIPLENILTNCNQLLNTVEYGLHRDRFLALTLAQELASSKYLNNLLVAQTALLADSKSDEIEIKIENDELKRNLLQNIDNWKEEFSKTKAEASDQMKLFQRQLVEQQQIAEDEETLRKNAWEMELLKSRRDEGPDLQSSQQFVVSEQQNLPVTNHEFVKNEEAWKEEHIRVIEELNDNIRILQLQLEASQKQCSYAEESYRRIKEENSIAIKQISEYAEGSSRNEKLSDSPEEHSRRITDISSNFPEENVPSSSASVKFLRNMLEKAEQRILDARKNTKKKSLNDEKLIENLQKEKMLLNNEISTLKITIAENQVIYEEEKKNHRNKIIFIEQSELENKTEMKASLPNDKRKLDIKSIFPRNSRGVCNVCKETMNQNEETYQNQISHLQNQISE